MNTASAEYLHISTHEPLETRKNHNELLLQEDALIFLLHSEHICTPSNFTLVAHPSATSEGSLHRSDGGFSRTDVPSSQYRVNLTVRHGVAALARRTWATSQQASQLLAHLEWWRAYSHFVRPQASLRIALVQPRERGGKLVVQRYRQRTPAMAAGRTNRRWTTREVLFCPLPPLSA